MPKNSFRPLKTINTLGVISNPGGFPIPNYTYRVRSTCPGNLIAYWPMSESTGTTIADESGNGRTGSYNNVTLGQAGNGDGRTSIGGCGLTSPLGNAYSTSLRDAINLREGTLSLWFRVGDIGTWSANEARRMAVFGANVSTDYFGFLVRATTSAIQSIYFANGTGATWESTSTSSLGWEHFSITFSRSASQVIHYYQGIARETDSSMGDFTGTLNDANAVFAKPASNNNIQNWNGSLCHAAIWTTPLTADQIKFLAKAT